MVLILTFIIKYAIIKIDWTFVCMEVWFTYNKNHEKTTDPCHHRPYSDCLRQREGRTQIANESVPVARRVDERRSLSFSARDWGVERVGIVLKAPLKTKVLLKKATQKVKEAPRVDHDKLILALIKVESDGRDHLVGDKHLKNKAYGCLQIRKPCLDDVNRACGTRYKPSDMLKNRKLSIWVCKQYLRLYGEKQASPSYESLAKIWNGGPSGPKKPATEKYWRKVSKNL